MANASRVYVHSRPKSYTAAHLVVKQRPELRPPDVALLRDALVHHAGAALEAGVHLGAPGQSGVCVQPRLSTPMAQLGNIAVRNDDESYLAETKVRQQEPAGFAAHRAGRRIWRRTQVLDEPSAVGLL